MMIVPVNRQINKTEYIANEAGSHAKENRPISTVRHLQLQDHDCDDDRDGAVTECSQTIFSHDLRPAATIRRAVNRQCCFSSTSLHCRVGVARTRWVFAEFRVLQTNSHFL